MRKCWPGEMESGVVCLFWPNSHPQQAPPPGTGREGSRGLNGREEGKIRDEERKGQWAASTQVMPD